METLHSHGDAGLDLFAPDPGGLKRTLGTRIPEGSLAQHNYNTGSRTGFQKPLRFALTP
jgi:hypothetical protein